MFVTMNLSWAPLMDTETIGEGAILCNIQWLQNLKFNNRGQSDLTFDVNPSFLVRMESKNRHWV